MQKVSSKLLLRPITCTKTGPSRTVPTLTWPVLRLYLHSILSVKTLEMLGEWFSEKSEVISMIWKECFPKQFIQYCTLRFKPVEKYKTYFLSVELLVPYAQGVSFCNQKALSLLHCRQPFSSCRHQPPHGRVKDFKPKGKMTRKDRNKQNLWFKTTNS